MPWSPPASFRRFSRARCFFARKLRLGRCLSRAESEVAVGRVRRQIEENLPRLEKIFLDLSRGLEPLSDTSHRLVEECETLLRLASGRENGQSLMQDTLDVLEGPLRYIDLCLQQRDRLIDLLTTCEHQAGAMLAVRGSMHATLAPLTYLTVLFKIESARLPVDLRETFLTVTAEIERMRLLVDETFTKNARLLADAQATLSGVRTRLQADFQRHADDVSAKRAQIADAIKKLDAQLNHNAERDLRMHNQSRIIEGEVGKIVEGLQFQDIIHQKCGHILDALRRPDFHDSGTPAKLQASQLDAVCADLDRGSENIHTGLESIRRETDSFDEICLKLDGLEGMVAAADGMVQLLLDVLGEVGEIMQVVSELTGQAHRAVEPMNDLARTLTSALIELSINMRLIALNAQIRSVQSGQGTGLEQLAARTAGISTEVTNLATTNFDELQKLRDGINEMLATFQDFRSRGDHELTAFHDTRGNVEVRLHAMRDQTLSAFNTISATLADVRAASASADRVLSPLGNLRPPLAAAAARLHELHHQHGTAASPDQAGQTASYTMASEHAVHASVFGKKFKAEVASPELFASFGTPALAGTAVATAPASSPPAAGELELF